MNIEQANCIPMSAILNKIQVKLIKETDKDFWCHSPLHIEKTASFHVNKDKNHWYDHGIGKGGTVVKFICEYLGVCNEANNITDALRWAKNMMSHESYVPNIKQLPRDIVQAEYNLELKKVIPLKNRGLISYAQNRGISEDVANTYLRQVHVVNHKTNNLIIALGLKNEENGYEIRNHFFKSSIGKKAISFVRGTQIEKNGVHFFEGMFDYLSVVVMNNGKPLVNDSIILNSNSLLKTAFPYLKGFGYKVAYSWMDNDNSGVTAKQNISLFCQSEEGLHHKSMQKVYQNFNDVNEWHMSKCNLRPLNT